MMMYRNVIVDGLRPSEEVDEPVEGCQLTAKKLFALDVVGEIDPFYVVDRDNTSVSSAPSQSPVSTFTNLSNRTLVSFAPVFSH